MTWKEAAIVVLQDYEYPMYPEEILNQIFSKNLKSTTGETPILTLRTEIYRSCIGHEHVKHHTDESIFYEDANGKYGLYSWLENNLQVKPTINLILSQNLDIAKNLNDIEPTLIEIEFPDEDDENVFIEGKDIYSLHKLKERNQDLVNFVKRKRCETNPDMPCEVCEFSFTQKYGELGKKFIEAHHTKPLSKLKEEVISSPDDIALVCSNCHKMIHRFRPWLSIESLKGIL